MGIDNLLIKEKVITTLDASCGTDIVPLYSYDPFTKSGYRVLDESLEIQNLKAVSWIYNLAEITFPIFELEDTESKKLITAINIEWTSPRIELEILYDLGSSGNWQKFAAYSLLNVSPYPYREYSLGNHPLGNNSMIGLQLKDVDYGVLQSTSSGQDKVVVFGDLIRSVTIEKLIDTSAKITNNFTTTPSIIVNSNSHRTGISFFNNSDLPVYIDTVNSISISSYLIKLNPGKFYEAPSPIYTGNYYGVAATNSTAIDIREFS